ncbi:hypothetical protein C8Q77DRAFT_741335 [Trametes polyzona]|nr:hypothetical protein C8Q77DRAFT_741335 [Trametes polyzona]
MNSAQAVAVVAALRAPRHSRPGVTRVRCPSPCIHLPRKCTGLTSLRRIVRLGREQQAGGMLYQVLWEFFRRGRLCAEERVSTESRVAAGTAAANVGQIERVVADEAFWAVIPPRSCDEEIPVSLLLSQVEHSSTHLQFLRA